MDAQVYAIWFVLPIVLLIEAAVVRYLWRGEAGQFLPGGVERTMASLARNWSGVAVILALWLVSTLIAWAYEFVFGLVVLHLLLFSLGRIAAAVGLAAFATVLAATPVALARLVLRLCRRRAAVSPELPAVRI